MDWIELSSDATKLDRERQYLIYTTATNGTFLKVSPFLLSMFHT